MDDEHGYLFFLLTVPKKNSFPVVSWLIKWIEKTKFSHICMEFFDYHKRSWIYESSASGTRFLGSAQFLKEVSVQHVYAVPVTKMGRRAFVDHVNKTTGTKYGVKQLLGLICVRFLKLFKLNVSNPFTDGYVCVEAAALALKASGYQLDYIKDVNSVGLIEIDKELAAIVENLTKKDA